MKNFNKKTELIIIAASLLTITLLWDTKIIYPVKLILILFHEASHALTAFLTGGKIVGIELNGDLSGGCVTEGGNNLLIALSGYPGSFIIAALLFFSAYNQKLKLVSTFGIPAALIFITANFITDTGMSIIIIIIAAAFFIIARFTPDVINRLFFIITGLTGLIYVALDLFADSSGENLIRSDVTQLSYQSGIPEFTWIVLWLMIFLVLFWYAGKKIIFGKS
ncbi:M50 family metallopeptidase [Melioribacter sp. Ez-97]|uniref:M50 family metallopeptidase n=1 Tax=Melioribacter sp. Ez-97 TaxID=3423434 RepID=UPI003ED900DA